MRRSRVSFTPLGIVACCVCVFSLGAPQVSAQATSQSSWAGPVEPNGWKLEDWKNLRLGFTLALKKDRLGPKERELLTRGIEYYLYSMTAENPPSPIIELRRQLMTHLRSPSPITSDAARDYMLSEVVRISQGLLDQPPGVRLNIMVLLASLSTNPAPQDPVPYEPADKVLLTVLDDPDQLVQCKIWSAIGLARISRDGNPNISLKSRIAVDLVNALNSPEAKNSDNWWYRMRLVDAIGDNGEKVNITQDPVAIDALINIIHDPHEHWIIRSAAARAISQLKSDSQTNIPLVTHEICALGFQMAQNYNQQLAQTNKEAPYWRFCFANWYLAFQPRTPEQKQRGWGLLQQAGGQDQPLVQAAYQASLPVINGVMRHKEPEPIPQGAIDGLDTWLQNNTIDNWKVTPGSDALKEAASEESGHNAAGSSGPPGDSRTGVSDVARSGS